ncbi:MULTISPECIES: hypothetical protein [Burkholderia]|uniref:hypothetical protein n=1 Tax=Burkholderia TaxID=32008 RepID=UPI0005321C9E|nr:MULTISPECIES: hypothetical protein [Burkholderia]AOJ69861.1 hypothetical protein WS78_14630 [Burkholderia savannae]AOK47988.1 hypothetical protein WT60_14855 [Burkholderia sp. MSMB617WGS]KGS00700.1 hypothetical protein X946_3783 [Burkholderia sp. ABCPW 111]KVG41301.1 hypothetical protein WS77_00825 [Burkholderia sp. MSMB0265]KVG84439.1 hypothetical protein WS81_06100 [Burkholderia sp. MSMB2040]
MGRSRYSIGETRSDWVSLAASHTPEHRFAAQAKLASAFSALFLAFAAEHGASALLSFAVDCRSTPEPGSKCLIAWSVEAVEPHSGLNGDVVRFNGRAWLPDGATVLSGTARAVVFPSTRVDSTDGGADEKPFPPHPAPFA